MTKGDWDKVFNLPIIEPTAGSREDPTVYVAITISVFHKVDMIVVNSIIVDAKWRSPRIGTSMTDNPLSL